MRESLEVKLSKKGRYIVANVYDGQEHFVYSFGEGNSVRHINEQIPKLYMDEQFDRKIRARFDAKKAV